MDTAIVRAADASRRNYRYFADVCGVSVGAKYTDKKLVEGVEAVQFFVTNKPARSDLKKLLPKFVFGRLPDGGIDTSVRFPTDVIELKNLRLCCGAGDKLELTSGRAGGSTLLFPMADAGGFYALTCSHVVGDMAASPSTTAEVRAGNETCFFRANVLANTVLSNDGLEYDIALAQLIAPSPAALVACIVSATGVLLTGFGDVDALTAQSELTLACPLSQA